LVTFNVAVFWHWLYKLRGWAYEFTIGGEARNRIHYARVRGGGFVRREPSQITCTRAVLVLLVGFKEADGIEFVPMIWGAWSSNGLASTLDQIANDTRVQRVLGFNEPDQTKQSNMNASVALRYWEQIESALPHVPLISPACAAPDGEWMQDFMSGLQQTRQRRASDGGDCPPRVDTEHVAVHWYGPANVETFQEKIRLFHDLYNKSLMITEFAVADWDATSVQDNQYSRYDVLEFMKAVVPWLESQSWIAAYAWFPFNVTDPVGTSSALFDRNGNLTRLGMYYKSVVNDNQAGNQSIVAWTGSR
jgi:Glycosyl hydrolase catalytic core